MATRKPATTHDEMIAAIAELASEVRHLREDAERRDAAIAEHVARERQHLESRIEAIEKTANANADFIRTIKVQGATWAVALSGFGILVWQAITFLWDKIHIR